MSTSWDEASKCPRDGAFTGQVKSRKPLRGGGQLVTLICPETNCSFHEDGWIVQIRPDNTIPNPANEPREKRFYKTSSAETRKRLVLDALESQLEAEQKAGSEVGGS